MWSEKGTMHNRVGCPAGIAGRGWLIWSAYPISMHWSMNLMSNSRKMMKNVMSKSFDRKYYCTYK